MLTKINIKLSSRVIAVTAFDCRFDTQLTVSQSSNSDWAEKCTAGAFGHKTRALNMLLVVFCRNCAVQLAWRDHECWSLSAAVALCSWPFVTLNAGMQSVLWKGFFLFHPSIDKRLILRARALDKFNMDHCYTNGLELIFVWNKQFTKMFQRCKPTIVLLGIALLSVVLICTITRQR